MVERFHVGLTPRRSPFHSLPTLTPELLATPRLFSPRGRTALPPRWVVLRHIVNHATSRRGQFASKLKRFGIQQPETDFLYWAFEQIPQKSGD